MKDLMIHVERIVRPIRASGWRKLRMRRELLAHLVAAFEEERSRGLDEAAARAAAKRRLGNPDDLRRELQAPVPWFERLEGPYVRGMDDPKYPRMLGGRWRPSRRARTLSTVALILVALLLPALPWILPLPPSRSDAAIRLAAPEHARAFLACAIAAFELSAAALYQFTVECIGLARPRSAARLAAYAAASALGTSLFLHLSHFAVSGRPSEVPLFDILRANAAFLLFQGAAGAFMGWSQRPLQEWLTLDLGD